MKTLKLCCDSLPGWVRIWDPANTDHLVGVDGTNVVREWNRLKQDKINSLQNTVSEVMVDD